MLVGPGGVATISFDDFEDRVGLKRAVQIERRALPEFIPVTRQFCRVDDIQGDVGGIILIDGLIKNHRVPALTRACHVGWIEDRARSSHRRTGQW
jgi:hypothetical protein